MHLSSEATVSSDKVKSHMSTLRMLDSLQSALQLLRAEIDFHLSTHTVEKQKKVRAGGKSGKQSCWKACII